MSIEAATVFIVAALIALMLTGLPLGIVTLVVSIAVALLYFGEAGLFLVSSNVYGLMEHYTLVAVPLFVLMASILERSGVATDLFDAMSLVAGRLRGGLAVQTTLVSVVLAAMTGVIGGEIVMLGLIALPQMLRLGYDRKLAIGTICAGGSLATLIPPSIIMIVYGLAAGVSVSELFIAGALPGALLGGLYTAYILVRSYLNPALAPLPPEELRSLNTAQRAAVLRGLVLPALLILWVLGSIYAGIASVTEAAGVGAVGAMGIAAVRRKLTWSMIAECLEQTMRTVGSIIWLILGAIALIGIFTIIGGSEMVRSLLADLPLPPLGVILVMMGILIVLGTFMEWVAIVFLTVPLFVPVVEELGFDPIWFGVLFVMNMQIYFLSPPFGPACFWLKSVAPPEITLQEIFRSIWPFLGLQVLALCLVIAFPEIALWLPRMLD